MSEPRIGRRSNHLYETLSEQLNLAPLHWVEVDPQSDPVAPIPCTQRERARQPINGGSHPLQLEANHMHSDTDIRELYVFTIIEHDQKVLQVALSIKNSAHGITVSTNIGKIPSSRVPGMPLYHAVLDYIQLLSTQRNQQMAHKVQRSAGETKLGRQVLGKDDWNTKFQGTLQQRGYTEVQDCIWEKVYTPIMK